METQINVMCGGRGVSAETWWAPPEGLPDVYIAMGQTAENVAQIEKISREDQDRWGVRSQNRTEEAIANGFFAREIDPITLADGTKQKASDVAKAVTQLLKDKAGRCGDQIQDWLTDTAVYRGKSGYAELRTELARASLHVHE